MLEITPKNLVFEVSTNHVKPKVFIRVQKLPKRNANLHLSGLPNKKKTLNWCVTRSEDKRRLRVFMSYLFLALHMKRFDTKCMGYWIIWREILFHYIGSTIVICQVRKRVETYKAVQYSNILNRNESSQELHFIYFLSRWSNFGFEIRRLDYYLFI